MRTLTCCALALTSALIGCGGEPRPSCGIVGLAGPTMLLEEFGVPNRTLGEPPSTLPNRLVARMVAGPALPALAGRTDSGWVVGIEGTLPAGATPSFGVLIQDPSARARGVLLYEGGVIQGAPQIGAVSIGAKMLPLIGIEVDLDRFEAPQCPLFPDSTLQ